MAIPAASSCHCPPEHSVRKLGHCQTCPLVGVSAFASVTIAGPGYALLRCGPTVHHGSEPHEFTWATYADDAATYGVCRCGASELVRARRTLH